MLLQTILIISVTLLIVNWSISGPIGRIANWVRETRGGKYLPAPDLPEEDVFKPLTREVRNMAASLAAARAAAQEEARLRDAVESTWTAERLGVHVRGRLEESKLLVISNRIAERVDILRMREHRNAIGEQPKDARDDCRGNDRACGQADSPHLHGRC